VFFCFLQARRLLNPTRTGGTKKKKSRTKRQEREKKNEKKNKKGTKWMASTPSPVQPAAFARWMQTA
jgi:hypothetical protein